MSELHSKIANSAKVYTGNESMGQRSKCVIYTEGCTCEHCEGVRRLSRLVNTSATLVQPVEEKKDHHFTAKELRILTLDYANEIRANQRQKAIDALISEREYQDSLDDSRTDHKDRSVGDYITLIGYYYQELLAAWTKNAGDNEALHVMRKIGGIALHCMEDHGAPFRKFKTTTHY